MSPGEELQKNFFIAGGFYWFQMETSEEGRITVVCSSSTLSDIHSFIVA